MNVLVIDVGGSHIKFKTMAQTEPTKLLSGPDLTPQLLVSSVLEATKDWQYDVVSIGWPGPVVDGKPEREPKNLGSGWVGFDFTAAFGKPVKLINDAAMQALGSYEGGRMLFLGLGTGLGATLILDRKTIVPLEVAHLPYRNKKTFEDHVGERGLDCYGKKLLAQVCGRRGDAAAVGPGGGLRGAGRRQFTALEETAAFGPPGKEHQRLYRRIPHVGRGRSAARALEYP